LQFFRELHVSDPPAAEQMARGLTSIPEVGSDFLGFHLTVELGRGTFGRVYLARQNDLAQRFVALKVSTEVEAESQTLAQLQHTNIMPIYSLHRVGPLQAVCMPYFGSTTLADILRDLHEHVSLPQSGKGLVSTLYDRQKKTRVVGTRSAESGMRSSEIGAPSDTPHSALRTPHSAAHPEAFEEGGESESGRPVETLQMLEGFTYVEAILWIMMRVADGLAHAHERGILHRDLKPANILLSDEGQPMLLDFNLAEDVKLRNTPAAAQMGGTLPYMSPEQLRAFQGETVKLDGRSDLYALGVILFELLTGCGPFLRHRGAPQVVVERMLEERLRAAPRLRRYNDAISPAAEAIVRRCLEPDPERRYQSARELREDLHDQLNHQPLRHTPEPSLGERLHKWVRRHPQIASLTTVTAVMVLLLLAVGALFLRHRQRLAQSEALANLHGFRNDLMQARLLLQARTIDQQQQEQGTRQALTALGRFGLPEDPGWREHPSYRLLPDDEKAQLDRELGDLLLLLADTTQTHESQESLECGLKWNRLALDCLGSEGAPPTLWSQREKLAQRLGQEDVAREAHQHRGAGPRDAWEHYLLGRQQTFGGKFAEALPHLIEATQRDPRNFAAWLLLGNCCLDGLGRADEAVAHYSTTIALMPDYYGPYYNRGLAFLRLRRHGDAVRDFKHALARRPDHVESLVHRALAYQGLRLFDDADADLTRALDAGADPARVYFLRSRVRRLAGDAAGAASDLKEGLSRTPKDELTWIARGNARVKTDPQGALADYQEALRKNPRSLAGLQNLAHVYSERLGRTEEAIARLSELLRIYPDFVLALAGRGVLHARLGHRDAALRDAEGALERDKQPATQYQVAGIYALASRQQPEDRKEAFRLLSAALRQGYGFEELDGDSDVDPLRKEPEFQELLKAVRALNKR
jgi:serine/threonine protein kinase/Flp pilus assembly protein TadD